MNISYNLIKFRIKKSFKKIMFLITKNKKYKEPNRFIY